MSTITLTFSNGNSRTVFRISPAAVVVGNAFGETHVGDKITTTISNANIGTAAIGSAASAVESVSVPPDMTISQEDYKSHIRTAQKALVDDQDRLEELSSGLYEALGQVLRVAREIQVEQNSLVDVEAMIKTTLDDAWAKQVAGRLKGKVLPATLGFVKVLLSSPLTAEIVKTWLAQ